MTVATMGLSCSRDFSSSFSFRSLFFFLHDPAPVYQMQEYYRLGELDDCFSKWRDFYQCIVSRPKAAPQVSDPSKSDLSGHSVWLTVGLGAQDVRVEKETQFWELKDHDTAKDDWDKIFGAKKNIN